MILAWAFNSPHKNHIGKNYAKNPTTDSRRQLMNIKDC